MTKHWGFGLVLLAASVAHSADPPAPQRIERTAEFQQRVDEAIERGVAWLRKTQAPDGSWPQFPSFPGATTALAYHTLRVCGAAQDDRAAKSAWKSLRAAYALDELQTYSAALYLMAIAEHGQPVVRANEDHDVRLSSEDFAWAKEVTRRLCAGQDDEGRWTYGLGRPVVFNFGPDYYDHSNTQYALLGLRSAARCGIDVPSSVWKKSLHHLLAAQERSGPEVKRGGGDGAAGAGAGEKGATSGWMPDHARGWGYQSCNRPVTAMYGRAEEAMTAGGVSSLAICRSELAAARELDAKLETDTECAIRDGLAWIGTNGAVPRLVADQFAPEQRGEIARTVQPYDYYGVERAGVLADAERMAGRDWYGVGATMVIAAETKDGAWAAAEGRSVTPPTPEARAAARLVTDTCFALLFLKKGTRPIRGALTKAGGDADINFGEAAKLTGRDLDDFLDLVLARWRSAADDSVKLRLLDGATSVGPRIVEPLLVRLDSADADERAAADRLLRHATDLDFGYVPGAAPESRDAAALAWQTWWMTSKDRVVYDTASKRLVVR